MDGRCREGRPATGPRRDPGRVGRARRRAGRVAAPGGGGAGGSAAAGRACWCTCRSVSTTCWPDAPSGRCVAAAASVVTTSAWCRDWLVQDVRRRAGRRARGAPRRRPCSPLARARPGGPTSSASATISPVKGQDHAAGGALRPARPDVALHLRRRRLRRPDFADLVLKTSAEPGLADRFVLTGRAERQRARGGVRRCGPAGPAESRGDLRHGGDRGAGARPAGGRDGRRWGAGGAGGGAGDGELPGILVGPGDPGALTATLRRWLTDPGLREELRARAIERRGHLAGWSVTAARVAAVAAGGGGVRRALASARRVRRSSGWSSGRSAATRSSTACGRSTCPCSCSAWRSAAIDHRRLRVALAPRGARARRGDRAARRAVASCYRAQFLNTVLPGGVLGDVHRGRRARSRRRGRPGGRCGPSAGSGSRGRPSRPSSRCSSCWCCRRPCVPRLPWVLAGLVVVAAAAGLAVRSARGDGRWSRLARTARDDVRLALLVRRSWPGVLVASLVALTGHVATYVVAARAVGVQAARRRRCSRWLLVVLVAAGLPPQPGRLGPAGGHGGVGVRRCRGWAPRTGVATAVAYGAMVLVAEPARAGRGAGVRQDQRPRLPRPGGRSVPERPYTILSCSISLDGYLGGATRERLVLSNDADLCRVDRVRSECDAILVGAGTVRDDNPRLLVRDPAAARAATRAGDGRVADEGDDDQARPARRRQQLLRDGRQREDRLLRHPVVAHGPEPAGARGDRRRRRAGRSRCGG